MIINFCNKDISFGSLKAQKRLGEKMLKEYRKTYPRNFHSSSLVDSFIIRHNGDRAFESVNKKLRILADKYNQEINNARLKLEGGYDTWDAYIEKLKKVVCAEKAANCGEQADLMLDVFLQNGEEAHSVCVTFYTKGDMFSDEQFYRNHAFVVSGLSRNADITKPKTWGNEAVVTDPWSNVVLSAGEAIDYFRKILGFNPKYHRETFEQNDKINIQDYLSDMKK